MSKEEFTPQDIEALKTQIKEDLQEILNRFNNDLLMWEKRSKCFAVFMWRYDHTTNRKNLEVSNINLIVKDTDVDEASLKEAETILKEASDFDVDIF